MIYLLAIGLVMLAAGYAWKLTARSAYESPPYAVIDSDGAFELREYPDLTLASTPMGKGVRGDDGSFMRLFRYISGENERQAKVAMTIPVFMETADPSREGKMGFLIPQQVAERGAPSPVGDRVVLSQRAGGQFAAVRFNGRLDEAAANVQESKLRQWIETRGYQVAGRAEIAGYDPPWTPGLLRRNEVLIRLDDVSATGSNRGQTDE